MTDTPQVLLAHHLKTLNVNAGVKVHHWPA